MTTRVPNGENGLYDIFLSYTKCISFLEIQDCVWDNISRLSLYLYSPYFLFHLHSVFSYLCLCVSIFYTYLTYLFVRPKDLPVYKEVGPSQIQVSISGLIPILRSATWYASGSLGTHCVLGFNLVE